MAAILNDATSSHELDINKLELSHSIRELLRTRVHPQRLILLVDRIHVTCPTEANGWEDEAYRVWLSDGEKSIQAVLKREIHPFVTAGSISQGSYVHVTKYKLATAKKTNGRGIVFYLQVEDLIAVGTDGRSTQECVFEEEEEEEDVDTGAGNTTELRDTASPTGHSPGLDVNRETVATAEASETQESQISDTDIVQLIPSQGKSKPRPERAERNENASKAPNDTSVAKAAPTTPSHPRQIPNPLKRKLNDTPSPSTPKSIDSSSTRPPPPKPSTPNPFMTSQTTTLHPITRPLKLRPLSALTGPNAIRNITLDILALIVSIAPQTIKHRGMPAQRDLKIMDTSTAKQVSLSVFVHPEKFLPAAGTVAMFRNVVTHEWDGGSLKAYATKCGGKEWFLPEPVGWEGRAEELRRAWRGRVEMEELKESKRERIRMLEGEGGEEAR